MWGGTKETNVSNGRVRQAGHIYYCILLLVSSPACSRVVIFLTDISPIPDRANALNRPSHLPQVS
ncbi:hypothetical protein BS17DRAFT_789945 [Gyrodon lividus]|nr:hypothetical protein BS17DRAFT_789945 [Gyrodon lividus]